LSGYSDQEIEQAFEEQPVLWVLKHEIKNEVGTPLEFEKRRYLWDIYNDLSPLQVLLKPPQIGATVAQVIKAFFVAKKLKRDIIYTLPTYTDVTDMVGGGFNRIIAQNPILMEWVRDHDTIDQKFVGDNIIRFRGTFTPKQATMYPSGCNIHDEVDSSNAEVLVQYENRLQAQEDGGYRWYFSHPSLAGFGIDIYWQQSDKKEWVISCNSCKRQQILSWPESLDRERMCYQCKFCKAELSNEERMYGEWLPTARGEFSGYHISQLILWNKSAKDIFDAKDDPGKNEQFFYNYVLGLPYIGSENKITSDVVLKNVVNETNEQEERIIIGVDTGLEGGAIHFTCMNKQGAFYYGTFKLPYKMDDGKVYDPYEDLEKLLLRWKQSIIIADQGGDLMGIRKLQAKYPGRVYLVFYRKDRKSKEMVDWGINEEQGTVRVDRNQYFQWMVEQLRDVGRIRFNGKAEEWVDWAKHFDNVYREIKVSIEKPGHDIAANYGAELIWKRNGPDHYCFVAGTKISTNKGDKNIEDIRIGDEVFTRNGYRKVYNAELVRSNQSVLTAYFSNGSSFLATPDHPLIHRDGKTRLDCTTRHAILYVCREQKYASIMESHTDGTQTLLGGQIGFTSHLVEPIEQKDTRDFISKYGLMPLVLFLKGLSFIIRTAILLITKYQTWCVRHEAYIRAITLKKASGIVITEQEMLNTWNESGVSLTRGARPPKGSSGVENMLIRVLCYKLPLILSVLSVVLKQLHAAIKVVSSVAPDVHLVGLHENIEKMDVINISVTGDEEYFANGILVSNCHTLLYCLVGLEKYGVAQASFIKRDDTVFPIASRSNNAIPARRVLGKKIQGYVDF
jgi:hypothetical protein